MPIFRPTYNRAKPLNSIPGNRGARSNIKKWLFFLILLIFSSLVIYEQRVNLIESFYTGNYQKMIVLLVILFPVLFIAQMLAKGRFYRRFGHTPLTLGPLAFGQRFNGVVHIRRGGKFIRASEIKAELILLEQRRVGQESKRVTHYDCKHWKKSLAVTIEEVTLNIYKEKGARILIEGEIPHMTELVKLDSTIALNTCASRYFWRLVSKSIDKKFKQSWDIPMTVLT